MRRSTGRFTLRGLLYNWVGPRAPERCDVCVNAKGKRNELKRNNEMSMNPNSSTRPMLLLLLAIFSEIACPSMGFSVHRGLAHVADPTKTSISADHRRQLKIAKSRISDKSATCIGGSVLFQSSNPNDGSDDDVDNFDAKGFGSYLAPYALALFASMGVTYAFVKFVLLDY